MITPEQLSSWLASRGSALPAILCFGDEPQRLQDTLDTAVEYGQQFGFDDKEVMVVEQLGDWDEVLIRYQERSLFSTQRLVLLYLNTKLASAQLDKLCAVLERSNPEVMLVIRAGTLDKTAQMAKWFKLIDQIGVVVHSKPLQQTELLTWLRQQAKQLSLVLSPDALSQLAEWSQGNLVSAKQTLLRWQLQGYTQVDDQTLMMDRQDWARYDVFALSDALVSRNVGLAIHIFDRLMDEGEDLVLILWAVSKELRLWKLIHDDLPFKSWQQIMTEHRLWRDRADRLKSVVQSLSDRVLRHWLMQVAQLDRMIKGQLVGDVVTQLRWLLADMASMGRVLPK